MINNEEFESICRYIEAHKTCNSDYEVFINLSNLTKIRNHEESESILELLKERFKIVKHNINGKDHLDLYIE